MHASRVTIVMLASLGAAWAIWTLRLPGDDAELAALTIAFVAGAGAGAALVRRRLVAGMTTIATAIGVWAATGGVENYLRKQALTTVGAALAIAMLALIFSGDPEDSTKPAGDEPVDETRPANSD